LGGLESLEFRGNRKREKGRGKREKMSILELELGARTFISWNVRMFEWLIVV
jgi:hypothetical protein